jgi:autotransporter-associated beta strand protein
VKRLFTATSFFSTLALAVAVSALDVDAATYTWTGSARDGNYINPANWFEGRVPVQNAPDTIVCMSDEGAGVITLGPLAVRIKQLIFQNNTVPYVLNGNGIVFQCSDAIVQTGAGEVRLNNLTIEAASDFALDINGNMILDCQLRASPTQAIRKTGAGSLDIMTGQTNFDGTLNLIEGSVRLSANPGGRGQIGIYNGTLTIAGGLDITNRINLCNAQGITHNIQITGDATLSGPLALNGNTSLDVNGPGRLDITGQVIATTATPGIRFIINDDSFAINGSSIVTLSGANTFAGNLRIGTGHAVLNNSGALPAGSKIEVTSSGGYIGYTENFASSFARFLENIRAINDPDAIVGIDSATPNVVRTINDSINLSILDGQERDSPYYLGTSSRITLTGAITPTRLVTKGDREAYDSLYLTAIHDGYLNVASQLGSTTSPVNVVVIGQPSSIQPYAGTVELSGNNSYAGGTRVLGGVLQINGSNNLGSGLITVASGATLNLGANGTVKPDVLLEPGSTISGNGTFNTFVIIGEGVNLVPGGFGKIGEMHLHGGVAFLPGAIWHIDLDTLASDTICVWDKLAIQGTAHNPITINLYSINGSGVEGALDNFDSTQTHSWPIAYRPASSRLVIEGFDSSYFNINADAFFRQNPGLRDFTEFGIEQIGNELRITFTPVPEPGAYALMTLGLGALAIISRRKRRQPR